MQKVLKKARPTSIEDLIALNALYRPGPMDNIDQFVDSKWERRTIKYPDPCLEGILKETYGVIVYQEQVMQVAQTIAGYSLGQADILRRAMGKKKLEEMKKEKVKFIAGAKARGFSETDADRIFEILIPFAGYGFNKSHSAAYAILAYQTAYLKANFPAEFMAANLSNEIASVDKLPEYIDEARRMGLALDPPDINRAGSYFTVVDGRIVYGFLGIKGLGAASAEEIVKCRKDGPYRDFMDFLDRVNIKTVGKKVVELLIQTGAFDGFGVSRAALAGNLEQAVDYAQNKKDDKKYGQSSLFDDTGEKEYPDFEYKPFPEWDRMQQLTIEKELLGFYFSGHPLDDYREAWRQQVTIDLAHPEKSPDGTYTLIGVIKTLRPQMTKKGMEMGFATLMDYNGEIELVFFSKEWAAYKDKIHADDQIAVRGRIDRSGEQKRERPGLLVSSLPDLEKLLKSAQRNGEKSEAPQGEEGSPEREKPAAPAFREVHIRLTPLTAAEEAALYPLRDYLFENPGPCSVYIHVPASGGETVIRTATQISAAADTVRLNALTRCAGVAEVWPE
jgi:DNA polymerase-3 subunit alpha